MDAALVCSALAALEGNPALFEEANLDARADALDELDALLEVIHFQSPGGARKALKRRAAVLRRSLARIDERLFSRWQARILAGDYDHNSLWRELAQYTDVARGRTGQAHYDYDGLDVLISGIFLAEPQPIELRERQPDMVHLEAVPASVILELVDRVNLTRDDRFYDLGSGLGQVAILVHLLTDAQATGIEYEPAFCEYARQCAARFALTDVEFVNVDARDADYAGGTVFFMFTPFMGWMLQSVLDRLYQESRERPIRVCTFGPCTLEVTKQRWLRSLDDNADHEFKLAVFGQ